MSLGHTAQENTPLTVLLATELIETWEQGFNPIPSGAPALTRLSYLFSPLSAPAEK